jgi:hypothetical protein
VDETYVQIAGRRRYVDRAVDQRGQGGVPQSQVSSVLTVR